MPKFNVNDKVSFINEKQDGIIKALAGDGLYIVEIEDGFPITVQEKELVLVKTTFAKATVKAEEKQVSATVNHQSEFIRGLNLAPNALYLICAPAVSGMINSGPVEIFLANTTSYNAVVACSFKGKCLKGVYSGKIAATSQQLICSVKRDEIFDLGELYIQVILHREGEFTQQPLSQRSFEVILPDHRNARKDLPSPYAFCQVQQILTTELPDEEQLLSLKDKFASKDKTVRNESAVVKSAVDKNQRSHFFYEVDLHIEELTDHFSGMSNADMIQLQLQQFRKKLDEAILNNYWKVVFIHGVGNGRLKTEIRKELSSMNLKYSDASYERYGSGATEVIL